MHFYNNRIKEASSSMAIKSETEDSQLLVEDGTVKEVGYSYTDPTAHAHGCLDDGQGKIDIPQSEGVRFNSENYI